MLASIFVFSLLTQDLTDDQLLEQLRDNDVDRRERAVKLLSERAVDFVETERRLRAALERDQGSETAAILQTILDDLPARRIARRYAPGNPITIDAHEGVAIVVAFSPDGRRVATGGRDGRILVWSSDLKKERALDAEHPGGVRDLAFSPDGLWLVSGGDEGIVRLSEISSGKPKALLLERKGLSVTRVEFDNDGETVRAAFRSPTGGEGAAVTLSARTGEVRSESSLARGALDVDLRGAWAVSALSSGGFQIVELSDPRKTRDVETGNRRVRGAARIVPGASALLIATGDGRKHEIALLQLRDGTAAWRRPVDGMATILCVRESSALVRVGSRGFWVNLGDGTLKEFADLGWVQCAAVSPDGATLATGAWNAEIAIWDVSGGTKRASATGHLGIATATAFSRDGSTLYTLGLEGRLLAWDLTRNPPARLWTAEARPGLATEIRVCGSYLALSPLVGQPEIFDTKGRKIDVLVEDLHPDGAKALYRLRGGEYELATFPDRKDGELVLSLRPTSVRFSSTGDHVIAVSAGDGVQVFETHGLQEVRSTGGDTFQVMTGGVDVTPDGLWLVKPEDEDLSLTRLKDGETVKIRTGRIDSFVVGPGRVVTLDVFSGIRLSGLADGKSRLLFSGQLSSRSGLARFSPDGRVLAFAGAELTLWSLELDKEIVRIDGTFESIRFDREGRRMAAVRCLRSVHKEGRAMAVSPTRASVQVWSLGGR